MSTPADTTTVPAQRGPRNPAEVGAVSESHVRTRLLELGYATYLPEGHGARSDLIYEHPETGALTKVQVKTGRLKNGAVSFQTCSVNGFTGKTKSYHGQCDEFMVWCPETRKVYRISVAECGVKMTTLRVDNPKGAVINTIRWAKDYEF